MALGLRHWRQRWDPDAKFVWSRPLLWHGEKSVPGEPAPIELVANKRKLRAFWERGVIHLARARQTASESQPAKKGEAKPAIQASPPPAKAAATARNLPKAVKTTHHEA